MKKLLIAGVSLALVLGFGTVAQSDPQKQAVYQKTLSSFSVGVTSLTATQKAQVRQSVEANPEAEKFICTGIRYVTQPQSANIEIRKRAKAACDYAKSLNPSLSTWVQSKVTQARSYAGKVLLTVKSPEVESAYYATFKNYCDKDPMPGSGFESIELMGQTLNGCGYATRIVEVDMPTSGPVASVTPRSELLSPAQCKIQNGPNARSALGFPRPNQTHFSLNPGPNTTYQVIAVSGPDAPAPKSKPSEDYGHYFKLIEDWSRQNSDWPSSAEVRIHDEYLDLAEPIATFKITHGRPDEPNKTAFLNKVIAISDSKVDFTGVDYLVIVVPPATPRTVVEQSHFVNANTAEARNIDAIIFGGIPVTRETVNSDHPMHWMHELVHAAVDFDDHYGDEKTYAGMGHWGIMTRIKTDWLTFEKWQLGYMEDNQVRCADGNKASSHWLAPSQIKTTMEKALIIPTGPYTAIVVESIRAVGMNYRLPERSEGALVYTINTNSDKHGYGYEVVTDEIPNFRTPFIFEKAPLKVGESVTVGKTKISVIEAGKWGDLVQLTSLD